jgi:hypothetical protein
MRIRLRSRRIPVQTEQQIRRMRDTGYASYALGRACLAEPACRENEGSGPRAAWRRVRAGSLTLARYQLEVPSVKISLTSSPAGRMIGEHLAIREESGGWRYRQAQAVLPLPATFADYMRGRSRQAVRTNVAHARRAGLEVASSMFEYWRPGKDDTRYGQISPGAVERWTVVDRDGTVVADSILSVDEHVALLQGLVAFTKHARWLLHTGIVERLCGSCEILLVNSDDAYKLPPGTQHFQRLLGYQIARLRVRGSRSAVDDRYDLAPPQVEVDFRPVAPLVSWPAS